MATGRYLPANGQTIKGSSGCTVCSGLMASFDNGPVAEHSLRGGAATLQRKSGMKPFLVLYATQEGQTQRIADHIGVRLRENGLSCEVINIKHLPAGFCL